jgi:hypothetical protein
MLYLLGAFTPMSGMDGSKAAVKRRAQGRYTDNASLRAVAALGPNGNLIAEMD